MARYAKNRREFIGLRVAKPQKEEIRRAAALAGMTISRYLLTLHQLAVQSAAGAVALGGSREQDR
jgi:uncharacterized protein (DUF1778 family)